MEGTVISSADEFCESILSHFSNSTQEHQHLCATIGTLAQELKEQNITLTPLAYFGATLSSLDRLLSTTDPPHNVVQSFTTILSLLLPKIPVGIVKKSGNFVSKTVVGALRMRSVTDGVVLPGLKCISHLLTTGDQANWSNLGQLYGVLLGYVTDSRSKVRKQAHLCLVMSYKSSKEHQHWHLQVKGLQTFLRVVLSVSTDEKSAVALTFNARLLSMGMIKIYSLHKQTCVIKLLIIFNALKEILASEHEEAICAAMEAFKNLINACVDETLIKQGVDQIINTNMDAINSGPTTIEKLCVTMESLLNYHYSAVWDVAFNVISAMFDNEIHRSYCFVSRYYSSYFMKGTIKNLADMQSFSDEDFPNRKQLHECLGSALGAMGPETFLGLLPLNLEANDPSGVNVWLFPILKQHVIGAHLSFFTDTLLCMIGKMKQRSQKLQLEGRIFPSGGTDALVYSVWSLLPSFCNYPVDAAESFKDLQGALISALREEHDIRGIICSSLQILISQNKEIKEGNNNLSSNDVSPATERAISRYSPMVAENNLNVLAASAPELSSVLSQVFMESTADEGGSLLSTFGDFASIAHENRIQQMKASPSIERAQQFDLAVALLPGLDEQALDTLFNAIKPALQDAEGIIQKKAYKVLSRILRNCDEYLSSKLEELLQLMIEVLPSCHLSAEHHRLDCLYYLIAYISKVQNESVNLRHVILGSFLSEIRLALKEANKKTRNRAYEAMHVEMKKPEGKEKACIKFLTWLLQLLSSSFLLIQRKNKEILKANLGLLKVLVAKSQAQELGAHLGILVQGLLRSEDDTKNHFKVKVKILLEMLVQKCGLDAVKAVMPEEHMKLLTNIRKIKKRKEGKLSANSVESKSQLSKATISRVSRWNHTKIFSDFAGEGTEDSGGEYMDSETTIPRRRSWVSKRLKSKASLLQTKKRRRADKSLPEDLFDQLEDEPLDS
ncbi:hypothetical protein SLE2022_163050 [Rubroshorea leprosula]